MTEEYYKIDIDKLKICNGTLWNAMLKSILLDVYSDLTLHLEGSFYEFRDLINFL